MIDCFQHKRIFLTGGTGFFGKWLLDSLPESARITVLSRDPEKFLRNYPQYRRFDYLAGDIRDFPLSAGRFDYVIHGATASTGAIPDAEMESVIIDGTRQVLKLDFDRMLYVSSGAVYGANPPEFVREDYCGTPVNSYGRGKQTAEQLCQSSGRTVTVARCFAFVGPHLPLDAHFAIGNFINDCLRNRPIVIKGDGTPRRSYLYAGDLVEWLLKILADGEAGRAYNVGSDQSHTIREIAELVNDACSGSFSIEVLTPPPDRPGPAYVPDIRRARQELGLNIKVSLADAVRSTYRFYSGR
jgi:dTDP-glucose 4,6-dehydratase